MRLTLALLTLLLAAPAVAQGAWNGQTLGGGHLFVDRTGLVVSGDGRALATWSFQDAVGNASRFGASSASRPAGAGAFGAARALTPRTGADRRAATVAGVAAYGAGRALLATTRDVGTGPAPRVRLELRFGRTDGTFGERTTIRTARGLRSASLSVNARGDAALAWFEDRGVRTDRVYVALRRAGHRFGSPQRLATGRIRGVAAAIGARGDALVAWDARGVLRTRFKRRSSEGFRATDTIRSDDAYFAELHPVVTPSGRAVLAWSAQFLREGCCPGDVYFQAARRPAGARRFDRAERLDFVPRGEYDGLGRPVDAVVDGAGAVTIAWRGGAGVRASRGGSAPQTLSAPGTTAVLSDLAAGPDGRLVAVWDGGVDDSASVVRAAIADGPGAAFGPPEDVSPAGRDARFGHAAFLGERPAVVVSSRPAGGGDSVAQSYVR